MTAKEKFEARLKELGLLDEWKGISDTRIAKFDENENIILFVHEADDDGYSEIHFPPYAELRENEEFRKECWNEFCDHDDANFVSDLALWLTKKTNKCPLFPVDAYFPAYCLMTYYKGFEDDIDLDLEEDEYQTGIDENRGKVELMEKQLDLFRKELVEMIRVELQRGHDLQKGFDPYPGWGALSFYGYAIECDTEYKITNDMSIIFIPAGGGVEKVSLSAPDFPINVLFNIYNSMK